MSPKDGEGPNPNLVLKTERVKELLVTEKLGDDPGAPLSDAQVNNEQLISPPFRGRRYDRREVTRLGRVHEGGEQARTRGVGMCHKSWSGADNLLLRRRPHPRSTESFGGRTCSDAYVDQLKKTQGETRAARGSGGGQRCSTALTVERVATFEETTKRAVEQAVWTPRFDASPRLALGKPSLRGTTLSSTLKWPPPPLPAEAFDSGDMIMVSALLAHPESSMKVMRRYHHKNTVESGIHVSERCYQDQIFLCDNYITKYTRR